MSVICIKSFDTKIFSENNSRSWEERQWLSMKGYGGHFLKITAGDLNI